MELRVRENKDQHAKCRCGLPFVKVVVVRGDGPPRHYPYWCARCDVVAEKPKR